jgi:hypothetical protein
LRCEFIPPSHLGHPFFCTLLAITFLTFLTLPTLPGSPQASFSCLQTSAQLFPMARLQILES